MTSRITANDKRLINGETDCLQLDPIKYNWAWERYLEANHNHWTPNEINMSKDISQWNTPGEISDNERLMLKRNFGFFSTAEALAANNILMGTYRLITAPECRMYLMRQTDEEAIHVHAYKYMIDSLRLDSAEISNMYREIPSVGDKENFCIEATKVLEDLSFNTGTFENDQKLLKALCVFAMILEGLFFYVGFVQILSLGRRGKLPGCSEMIQYILRDESLHLNFGIDLVNAIKQENPSLWTDNLKNEITDLMKQAVVLEKRYAEESMPNGILGLTTQLFNPFCEFIANRRLGQIGLPSVYVSGKDHFPWMAEMMDLKKEKNFFETRVIEYQTGSNLTWE